MKSGYKILIVTLMVTGLFCAVSCKKDSDVKENELVKDIDGNSYNTVTIGTQTWLLENLRTIRLNDGTEIPNVTDINNWQMLKTAAYCNYNNSDNSDSIKIYGRLYNWYAVNSGKLAPQGWHIPSQAEWATLADYLGSDVIAGDRLKLGGKHWLCIEPAAVNISGFSAVGSGHRSFGKFEDLRYTAEWWSTSENPPLKAYYRLVRCGYSNIFSESYSKDNGLAIRCIKDK